MNIDYRATKFVLHLNFKKTVDSIWLKIMCPLLEKFTYFSRGLFSFSIFLGSWRDLVTDLVMIINYIQLVP